MGVQLSKFTLKSWSNVFLLYEIFLVLFVFFFVLFEAVCGRGSWALQVFKKTNWGAGLKGRPAVPKQKFPFEHVILYLNSHLFKTWNLNFLKPGGGTYSFFIQFCIKNPIP